MPEPTPTPAPAANADNSSAQFQALLASMKGLNASEREEKLLRDNYKLRDKLRDSRTEVAAANGKIPKDGTIVLTAEQGKEWQALLDLKLPVAKIKETLTAHDKLAAKDAERSAKEDFATAGEQIGVANIAALQKLLVREGLALTFSEVKVRQDDGTSKTERVPYVKKAADDKAQPQPLVDYLEAEWMDFLPVLMTAPEEGEAEAGEAAGGNETRRLGQPAPAAREIPRTPLPARSGQRAPSARGTPGAIDDKEIEKAQKSGIYASVL